jgi:hypothetical protein
MQKSRYKNMERKQKEQGKNVEKGENFTLQRGVKEKLFW